MSRVICQMADKSGRSCMWATVVYPDSMPEDFLSICESFYIPLAISPLHDSDISADGSPKKPHYHVLFHFGTNKKSKDQFLEYSSLIGGVGALPIGSNRAYARYLCHLDDPNKHQYSVSDVITYGGYDYVDVISSGGSDLNSLSRIIQWCNDNNCYCFADLIDFCRDYNMEWFSILTKRSSLVREYMKSKTWKISQLNVTRIEKP